MYLLFPIAILLSVFFTPKVSIQDLGWLQGTWQQDKQNYTLYESWHKQDDSTMVSASYYLKGKDTIWLERVRLEQRLDKLTYIAAVNGQNNEQPVGFTLVEGNATRLVFENPDHDFPQRITYTFHAPDSLIAEISGTLKGKAVKRQFPMKRMQVK
ncbi:DUF6265 family protein [Chitinophaga silvisoli]|uniref:DUF6265 domain-containing protein n=1 Tax=Chitinophaga silvisoli TaxID=2291814 RepID=A0A3E1P2T6_9BACT|nr:DUF6265 family protein [Chitinophaga silvisoli]RFM34475.1 hypothetical protein DXN04_14460 [Chitinophaga silvisoli]